MLPGKCPAHLPRDAGLKGFTFPPRFVGWH
jgi:hypothetical protein